MPGGAALGAAAAYGGERGWGGRTGRTARTYSMDGSRLDGSNSGWVLEYAYNVCTYQLWHTTRLQYSTIHNNIMHNTSLEYAYSY